MTLHTYTDVEQRSDEWFDLRRGIVTASNVGALISTDAPDALEVACPTCPAKASEPCLSAARKTPTPIKTAHEARAMKAAVLPPIYRPATDTTAQTLTATLVAERITGTTEQSFVNADMLRGIDSEPYARDVYSGLHQQAVEVGFMLREEDGWQLGLSPDGLVGDDGGIEIKAPRAKTHVTWILADEVPRQHMAQVQAALFVTGRAWWDFVSFYGGLPLFVKRVYPDPRWFEAIEAACRLFETNATETVAEYRTRTHGLPLTDRLPDPFEVELKL